MEIRNNIRLRIWYDVLEKAYIYLLIDNKNKEPVKLDIEFPLNWRLHRICWSTFNSIWLLEASVVNFMQIFNIWYKWNWIYSNKDDDIVKFRNILIEETKKELKWDNKKYEKLYNKINESRNCFLAHYDWNKWNYSEENWGTIKSYRIPGIFLDRIERIDYELLVKTMLLILDLYINKKNVT